MDIASAFEREPYSKQHWQNTTGGIWLDLTNMGDPREDGASGSVFVSNDTKGFAPNGTEVGAVDVPSWNWKTDNHVISLVLADSGFTMTWNSILDDTYVVYYSTDLIDWSSDIDDSITGEDSTTSLTFGNPEPGTTQLFFRVEPNP